MNTLKTEHTPGPWSMSRDGVPPGHVQITVYAEASGQRVATAFEQEANAYLIAAAPDLLRLLAEFVRCRDMEPQSQSVDITTLREARAAIARAEGKEGA